jgi:predicted small lipoprotein YifL
MVRRAALRLFVGGSVLALTACGRKGSPLPPIDVDPCYPRHYPMDETAKAACEAKERYAREHPPQPPPPRGQRQRQTTPPAQPPAAQPPAAPPAGEQPPLAPLPGVPPFPGAPPISPPPPGTQ